jgi:hypothetical protein
MGMKLYPPVVENTLPACYKNEKGIAVITIPFSMNRAVSAAEVGGFELKIKTIQTGSYLGTYHQFDSAYYVLNDKASSVTFYIDDILDKMKPG